MKPAKPTESHAYDHREATTKKPAKKLDHMRIHKGQDGGHIVEHHFSGYEHQPERFPFGDTEGAAMMEHVAQHAGVKMQEPDEDDKK
jgi:hypothetical protein